MAAIDELSTFAAPEDPYRTTGDNEIGLSDYVRKFAADAYAIPGQLAGAAEYAFRIPSGTDLESIRDWSEEGAQAQIRKMSPGAQRNLNATFLPGEGPTIFDKDISTGHALGLRAVGVIPSVLASIIPGALVARVAGATAGTLAGTTVAAGQTAGDTYNAIVAGFRDMPDDQLRAESPAYQGFRNMGMSEREARERLVETVTSYKPALMGAITMVTSRYGVEGLVASRVAGETGRGLLRSTGRGLAGEAAQEAIESGSQQALEQQGAFDLRGVQGEYNWAKILEDAVGGAVIGGIVGGGVGAATAKPGASGGRRRTRDEILGKPTPEQDQKPPEASVPVAVAPTAVSPSQSTEEVLSEVRAKETADGQAIAAEQNTPVKAGEEMPAAIAQKAPEQPGGVDLKPGEAIPALTPTTVTVDPDQAVALTAPASVPQTAEPQPKLAAQIAQLRLINPKLSYSEALATAEQLLGRAAPETTPEAPEAIPPIPAHSVVEPGIAAAITKGIIDAKVDQAATPAPRPDPAAALATAAAPAATGAVAPAPTPATVAPATGVPGAVPAAAVPETPVVPIPSEVIPPTVEAPAPAPVKRKPGRPRKSESHPAVAGQSAPLTAEEKDARNKLVTDHSVASLVEIIRKREDALRGIEDVAVAKPIVDEAKASIDVVVEEAAKVIGKRKASTLAYDARQIVNAERAAAARAAPRPEPTGQILESAVETKEVADPRPIKEIIAEIRAENPDMTAAAAAKRALAAKREKVVARTPEVIAKERKGPRTSAAAKEQIAAGETEVLSAEEAEKRKTARENAEAAARLRRAMEDNPYDPNDLATIKPQRAYIKRLLDAVGKTNSLVNLPAESDQYLKHLAAAKKAVRDFSDDAAETMADFMSADFMLRQGQDPYAAAPVVTGASFDEQAAAQTDIEAAGGTNLVARQAETSAYRLKRRIELGRETKKIKREKIETLKYREQLRREGPAEPEAKVAAVTKKARLSPAEIKARAAAARAGVQTKRADALEEGATARTEAEGVQQTEGIIRASFGEDDTFEEIKGDILGEVGPVARLRARVAAGVAAVRGRQEVRFKGRVVYGEYVGSVQDALHRLTGEKLSGDMQAIVDMARENFDNIPPVYVLSPTDMYHLSTGKKWVGPTRHRDIANKMPKGMWMVNEAGHEQIVIRDDVYADKNVYAHTLVHESGHSEIGLRSRFNDTVAWNVNEIRHEVRRAWIDAGKPEIQATYALYGDPERTTDEILMGEFPAVDEFLAELISNRHLQQFLFRTRASDELRVTLGLNTPDQITPKFTMWETIMAYFSRVLGMRKPDVSLLDVSLRQWEVLNEYGESGRGIASPPKAIQAAYFGEETVETAKDLPKSLPAYLQRWGLAGATVDQLVRWTHTLFKDNAMRRFEKALQQMHATSQDEDKPGQALAGRWEQLSRDDPLEVQKAAEVFNTANIYDLDPSKPADQDSRLSGKKMKHVQRKAMFPQLREDFLALKPGTRELMEATSSHFKSLQVKQITQATHNLLYGSKKFTPAQIKDITDATLDGKLIPADPDNPTGQSHQEIIDDDGTWRLLKNYFSVLKARGMYFPLMRHGNWVVTTDPKLPEDLKGAKVLTDKTTRATKMLEWRGSSDDEKKLRAQHDAFFEENVDPTQVSSRIVRYKPGTNEVISELDSRGHAHDIAFQSVVQTQGVYFFESNAQARRFIRQSGDLNPDAKPLERKNWDRDGGIAAAELSGLMSTIDRRADMSEQQKELTKSIVKQAAVQLMPGNRMQHRALKRKGVKGADMDLPRNTSEYSSAASSVLGKMTHMPAAREALEDMSAQHKENLDNKQDPNNQLRGQIINELVRRVDTHVIGPKANSRVVQNIMTLTFSAKLLSPAYWIMNGTQPWTVLLPSLGAKYGNMKSSAALWNSYRAIGLKGALIDSAMNMGRAMSPSALKKFTLDLDDPWTDIRKNVAKQEDGDRLSAMLKEVIDARGMVDDASAFELGHGISRGPVASALGKLDRIARQMPFGVEAINRSVTLVSAYRLAYEINKDHEAAVQAAIDELQSTQFNYASYNQPAFFNKPILRPGVQFKKFAQNIFALLAGAIHQSFKGATRTERKQAQKLLMNFFGVTMVTAGMLGLPGLELLRVAFTLSAMLGFTDGWEDQERKLRRLLRESIGKTPEELISKGILSRAAGIDLSTRLGYADMFTFSEPKTMDAEGMHAYLWRLFAGAPGSVITDFGSGISAAGNGDWTQAIIKMVPAKVVADIAKAARGRFDATTKEPINSAEAVLQAIGFRSARMAERGEEVGATISQRKKFEARAKELNAAYLAASTKGELLKIRAQILAHNRAVEAAKAGIRQKAYAPKTLDRIRDEKRTRREALVGAD